MLVFCLCLTFGCSEPTAPDKDASSEAEKSESGYTRTIDKARNVEDQLQEAADKKQREAEAQGEG